MNRDLFIKKYKAFNESDEDIKSSVLTIEHFEDYIQKDIESATIKDIEAYMNHLIDIHKNTYDQVIHFTRYFYYVDMKDQYIHMTKYFNSLGVLENIIDRINQYESKDIQQLVISKMELPPFGTSPKDMPRYTKRFMNRLQANIDRDKCNKILAGNNHKIPDSSFSKEKEYYEQSSSLAMYLKERHERKVKELTEFYENNRIWFEQIITRDVIDFVSSNQEILSGVLKDDKIYVTKIPYDINRYLEAKTEQEKQYWACHCSFVRENILSKVEDIPKEWCYCSGGFAKRPFEVIFDQTLDVELLNTAIDGDNYCRFAIDVSGVDYKRG
jgi:hypothetical protein